MCMSIARDTPTKKKLVSTKCTFQTPNLAHKIEYNNQLDVGVTFFRLWMCTWVVLFGANSIWCDIECRSTSFGTRSFWVGIRNKSALSFGSIYHIYNNSLYGIFKPMQVLWKWVGGQLLAYWYPNIIFYSKSLREGYCITIDWQYTGLGHTKTTLLLQYLYV